MVPGNAEFVAYERHKDLLRDTERRRLIKLIQRQPSNQVGSWRTAAIWVGGQLVKLGLRLQGQNLTLPAQSGAARAIEK